jgi:hypothetical protein
LNSGVSAVGKMAKSCWTVVSGKDVVFQQWEKKGEKLWNGGVSAVGKRHKVVEQWCFSNGESGEKLLNSGVSAMKKMSEKVVEQWCFSNGEACLFLK